MHSQYLSILIRLLIVVTVIISVLFTSYLTLKTAYPFIIGLMIAFFINPLVNFFQEKIKLTRWLSVTIVLLFFIGAFIASLTIFISEIIIGTSSLSKSVPLHFQKLIYHMKEIFTENVFPVYEKINKLFYSLDSEHQAAILGYIETITAKINTSVSDAIQTILNGISEFLLGLPNLATVIMISLLATFFLSKDWYKLVFLFRKWIPNIIVERTKDVLFSLKKAFVGFLLAQLTLISITCCIVLIGLLILRIDYPITIAFIIAIVDLLPYLGTGLIFIPWIFYSFFSGQMTLTIGLSILYGIVVIQRQLMEPKILSTNIGVDPLASLVSLFVGYKIFGFLGLMIGPIILVLLQTLHNANVFRDLKKYIFKS